VALVYEFCFDFLFMATGVNPVLQLDDNLVNGASYTFVFQCTNLFTNPSASTLVNDLNANAPDFLMALQVVPETGSANKNFYNVVFTYEGDGSDVVSDVANAMQAAFQAGSNDSFTFLVGFGAAIPTYSATSGGGSSGISYQFDPLNVVVPVTPSQSAAYATEASQQVNAVGASPGGQVAAAVSPSFAATVTAQATSAQANVSQIATQANQTAASSTVMVLVAVAAAVAAFFFLAKPKFSVGAA
jgi:hypothetical protein